MKYSHYITAFYKFTPIPDPAAVREELYRKGFDLSIRGLIVLAKEGLNGTISSSSKEKLEEFKVYLEACFGPIEFKDSGSLKAPFPRYKIRLDQEIVAIGDNTISPTSRPGRYLSPQQWDQFLSENKNHLLIDVRNSYEVKVGTFRGAIDPKTEKFNEFPEFVRKLDVSKETPVLMFCTGGIRCEKASVLMEREGFSNVYQLHGGILNYIKERPNSNFEGECFVFDRRVSVDQDLAPSKIYGLCHYCGDPGTERIACSFCNKPSQICHECHSLHSQPTCSKNCSYHLNRKLGKAENSKAVSA